MKPRPLNVNKAFSIATSATVALCVLTASPLAQEGVSLSAPPAMANVTMENECDRLAGSAQDSQRNRSYAPVGSEEINSSAIDACRTAFDTTGNPRFAFQLGRALNTVEQMDQAMNAYSAAVAAGYPAAKVNFGMLMGRLGDETAEFRLYSEAANAGNILAAYNLGVSYRDGLGTAPDAAKALHWFEVAAAAGDSTAAFNIGVIYDEGKLVPQDDQTAIAWYDLAVQRGNADAMINLGIMYETGEGIPANAGKAVEMYALAAERGDLFGAEKLMEMQEAGLIPAPKDEATGDELNTLVLKEGDMEMPSSNAKGI